MADSTDNLVLSNEGDGTRLRAGRKNYLFRSRSPEEIRPEYDKSIAFVREHYSDGWTRVDPELTQADFDDLTQDIALHHMYYYVTNEFRVRITQNDLKHPQTRSTAWEFMKRKFRDDLEKANRNAARFLGLSDEDFSSWLTGWELQMSMR